MPTGTYILTEGDDADTPMSNVVSFNRPQLGDPLSLGDILAGIVLPDLAVRMRGQFELPRLVALTARED